MLIDSTLREGEQAFGVYFNPTIKKQIVELLLGVGIEEIELGCATQEDLPALTEQAFRLSGAERFLVWSPGRLADIKRALKLGFQRLHISLPLSDSHRTQRLNISRQEWLTLLHKTLETAKSHGATYVSVGLEDVSRADTHFLAVVAGLCADWGVNRIRLSDTVGLFSPVDVLDLLQHVKPAFPGHIAWHGHNDFGMATANALTALTHGASHVDVSVLGLGERAGIARLEEVVAFLAVRHGRKDYRLELLPQLCDLVAKASGRSIPPDKAVVGSKLFVCETGIHIHGLLKDPTLFEPFPPERVDTRRTLALGKKSGRAALQGVVNSWGREVPSDETESLLISVRALSARLGRPLAQKDVLKLIEGVPQKAS